MHEKKRLTEPSEHPRVKWPYIRSESMKRFSLAAVAISAVVAISSVVPAAALPVTQQTTRIDSQIETVAKIVIKRGNWRGHRGHRAARPGYRRHTDGFWYPRAAFTVRVAPGVRVKFGPRHSRWCRDRYQTYRASDNTYVVRSGVRRACRSPF
ncbi:MAG: BA14K family protein [Rhizobium sp.]|nr:BA14K family protein [Rhizobium sp.]